MAKKVKISKKESVKREELEEMREKPGSSNVGKYKNVAEGSFCGPSGKSSRGSFPVNTLKRARNALARAYLAPFPEGIRRCVRRKWGKKIKSLAKKK